MFALSQNQISSELAGETIILNHKAGAYYGLDEVGSLVWRCLQESPVTLNSLVKVVADQFNVDELTCTSDLERLLMELIDEKLVEAV